MKPILISTAVAGTLDLALAITFFAIKGVPLEGVPHAVAAGLLGVRAFRLGLPTAILGVALHYFIAFCVSAFYYFLSRRFGFLNNHPIASGAIYGIGVFLFMQHVVLPLSAEPRSHPTYAWLIANIASHIFFIGIAIALITRRFSTPPQASAA